MALSFSPSGTPGATLPGGSASLPGGATKTGGTASVQTSTFYFVAGWILLIVLLTFANRTRLGHVIIYYSLLLIIIFILVTEYQQITPYFNSLEVISQLNQ